MEGIDDRHQKQKATSTEEEEEGLEEQVEQKIDKFFEIIRNYRSAILNNRAQQQLDPKVDPHPSSKSDPGVAEDVDGDGRMNNKRRRVEKEPAHQFDTTPPVVNNLGGFKGENSDGDGGGHDAVNKNGFNRVPTFKWEDFMENNQIQFMKSPALFVPPINCNNNKMKMMNIINHSHNNSLATTDQLNVASDRGCDDDDSDNNRSKRSSKELNGGEDGTIAAAGAARGQLDLNLSL